MTRAWRRAPIRFLAVHHRLAGCCRHFGWHFDGWTAGRPFVRHQATFGRRFLHVQWDAAITDNGSGAGLRCRLRDTTAADRGFTRRRRKGTTGFAFVLLRFNAVRSQRDVEGGSPSPGPILDDRFGRRRRHLWQADRRRSRRRALLLRRTYTKRSSTDTHEDGWTEVAGRTMRSSTGASTDSWSHLTSDKKVPADIHINEHETDGGGGYKRNNYYYSLTRKASRRTHAHTYTPTHATGASDEAHV